MSQVNPVLWVKASTGFFTGFTQPNVGFGSFFRNWKITITYQQNPTSFPFVSPSFGNYKNFTVDFVGLGVLENEGTKSAGFISIP